jgi:hypothetical protein
MSKISFHLENDYFQESYESIQPIYDSYDFHHRENCDLVGGKSFSLCFSSFNLLKEKIEFSYRAKRVELQNYTSILEHNDHIISKQQPFYVVSDPMVLYMDNFIEVEIHDKENNHIVAIFSENDLAFEKLEQEQSTFEENDTVKKQVCRFLYTCEQQVVFTHILQDPFEFLLEISYKETFMSYLESISGIGSSKWMSFQIGFNFQFELPLSRVMQRIQSIEKVILWLHWIFYFTRSSISEIKLEVGK